MIVYFSATGNSRYAAKRLGKALDETPLDLFEKIRTHDRSALHSETPWVVVCPTYAWRMPRFLEAALREIPFFGIRAAYFVMTCDGGVGNAPRKLKKLCADKGLTYMGCAPVYMPENYIALFRSPSPDEARDKIERAEAPLDRTAGLIAAREPLPPIAVTQRDKLLSGAGNALFYRFLVRAKKFRATDACVSCGLCEKVCPLNNIRLEKGRPIWGKHCTHCMACICRCPTHAIEYGKHTEGLTRYTCPKDLD